MKKRKKSQGNIRYQVKSVNEIRKNVGLPPVPDVLTDDKKAVVDSKIEEAQEAIKALEQEILAEEQPERKSVQELLADVKHAREEHLRCQMVEMVSAALAQLTGTCPVRGKGTYGTDVNLAVSTLYRAIDVWHEGRKGKPFAHNYDPKTGEITVYEMQKVQPPSTFRITMENVIVGSKSWQWDEKGDAKTDV